MSRIEKIINDSKAGLVNLTWEHGEQQQLSATYLRGQCRCAECKAKILRGQDIEIANSIQVEAINVMGNYGVQFIFSDGHDRGIYPWAYLQELRQSITLIKE